jgi:hypothetical protein
MNFYENNYLMENKNSEIFYYTTENIHNLLATFFDVSILMYIKYFICLDIRKKNKAMFLNP